MMRLVTVALASVLAAGLGQTAVADHPNAPGSVAFIKLGASTSKPEARFGRRQILVIQHGIEWLGVVGLPHDLVPGEYIVTLNIEDDPASNVPFMVRRHSDSSAEIADISKRQLPDESEVLKWTSSEKFSPTLPFAKPVFGDSLATFDHADGLLTLSSTDGASVVSPKAGRVLEVRQDGPGAHRVTIDHGANVFSIIAPVYDVAVSENDDVLESMRLGSAGAMAAGGRSGINWSVAINGVFVNPDDLTRTP